MTHDGEHGGAQKYIYGDPDFILLYDENTYQVRNLPDNYVFHTFVNLLFSFTLDNATDTCQTFNDTSAAFAHVLWTRRVTSATLRRVLFKRTRWR